MYACVCLRILICECSCVYDCVVGWEFVFQRLYTFWLISVPFRLVLTFQNPWNWWGTGLPRSVCQNEISCTENIFVAVLLQIGIGLKCKQSEDIWKPSSGSREMTSSPQLSSPRDFSEDVSWSGIIVISHRSRNTFLCGAVVV